MTKKAKRNRRVTILLSDEEHSSLQECLDHFNCKNLSALLRESLSSYVESFNPEISKELISGLDKGGRPKGSKKKIEPIFLSEGNLDVERLFNYEKRKN